MSTETYYAVRESGSFILPKQYPGKRAAILFASKLNEISAKCGHCGERNCRHCEGQSIKPYDVVRITKTETVEFVDTRDVVRITKTETVEFVDTRDAPPDTGHPMLCMCSRCM